MDLLADAVLKPQGKFTLAGERVDFSSDGKKLALAPKPPLLGLKKAADLKLHSPEYVRDAKTYTPNAQSLAALKKHATPARVLVFFGWFLLAAILLYFAYGMRHSRLARGEARALAPELPEFPEDAPPHPRGSRAD